jgi:hypothetical protein
MFDSFTCLVSGPPSSEPGCLLIHGVQRGDAYGAACVAGVVAEIGRPRVRWGVVEDPDDEPPDNFIPASAVRTLVFGSHGSFRRFGG